jgi:hypothetical protein
MQGFGRVKELSPPIAQKGKSPNIWQWFWTEFGQTLLIKRRQNPIHLDVSMLPVNPKLQNKLDINKPNIDSLQLNIWHTSEKEHISASIGKKSNEDYEVIRKDPFLLGQSILKIAQNEGVDATISFVRRVFSKEK